MKRKEVVLPETTGELLVMLVDAGHYGMTAEEMAEKLLDLQSPDHDRADAMFRSLHDDGYIFGFKAWGQYIFREVTISGKEHAGEIKAKRDKTKWCRRLLGWTKEYAIQISAGIIASLIAAWLLTHLG